MTVSEQTIFTASTANGVTTVFPYTFKITDEEDLAVTVDGVLQTSGYTVSGVGDDAGGNVTFTTAPANLAKVVRYLAPKLKRETDYQQFGDWDADVVDNDFDRLWLALQAKNQDTSRSIKLPVDTADDQTIEEDAATRAGKFISFDSYGNVTLSVLADLTTLSAVSAFMETLLDDANATAARATLGAASTGANTFTGDQTLGTGRSLVFEGATDDGFETTLSVTDPTADRAIVFPNNSGTVALTSDVASLAAAARPYQSVISYTGTGGISSKGGALTIASGSATVPADTTIPQSSEMGAVVDVSITPSKVGAVIEVEAKIIFCLGTSTRTYAAIFKDSGADALTVSTTTPGTAGWGDEITLLWRETAASLTAMNFKAKIGTVAASNIYLNADGSAGAVTLGGVFHTYIKATEIAYT